MRHLRWVFHVRVVNGLPDGVSKREINLRVTLKSSLRLCSARPSYYRAADRLLNEAS